MARSKEFDIGKALDDAMAVFWLKGYQGASIQDLVEATGVNRASLYDTFGGKHEIFEKALARFQRADEYSLERLTAKSRPGLQRIVAAFKLAGEQTLRDPRGCLVVNSVSEAAASDPWIANTGKLSREGLERFFEKCLKQAKESGEIGAEAGVRPLARYLTNALFGLRVIAHMQPGKSLIEDIVTTTLAALR